MGIDKKRYWGLWRVYLAPLQSYTIRSTGHCCGSRTSIGVPSLRGMSRSAIPNHLNYTSHLHIDEEPYTPTRHLRSSSDNRLVVPPKSARSQPKLFSCLAPQWWNQLPTSIRDTDCLPTFKKRLKMHLFREYNGTLKRFVGSDVSLFPPGTQ